MPNTLAIWAMASGASWLLGTCALPTAAYSADATPADNSNATGSSGLLEKASRARSRFAKVTEPLSAPISPSEPPHPPPTTTVEPLTTTGAAELPTRAELSGPAAKAAVEAPSKDLLH